ncbi:MAG: RsmB/NOP family class I SAM-dependent RNA methyltransferase [Hyphomicrobiaceae bacterium]|nr:RsmB/NOP family class I SAM-dependent RNA methyltransferase [Hyphomicrobiaceae bacterium]
MTTPKGKAKGRVAGFETRRRAAEILKSVLAGGTFEPLGEGAMAERRDRALVNRLITTALRRSGHLDLVLGALLERGMPPRSGIFEGALRIGLAELIFLDGADHSAVFVAVEIIRADRRAGRFAGLANAVLRQAQRERDKWAGLSPVQAIPVAAARRWGTIYDEDVLSGFGAALIDGAALDLTVKTDAGGWAERLGGAVLGDRTVRIERRDRRVDELDGYADGVWWVQDFAASLPARMVDAPAGALVLDLCAAPGGKTAQLVAQGYEVVAVDIDGDRMARVEANHSRLGLSAELVVADALDFDDGRKFDAILLDAPCTATGTFRRHPEALINRSLKDISRMAALQARLIDHALMLLKPGGVLVYCTCSLEREEGEEQAEAAIRRHAGLQISPPGLSGPWAGTGAVDPKGWLRTHPAMHVGNMAGMDGFFAVRFKFA